MYASRRNQLELPSSSPISKLPIELLSEIFTLCTQEACEDQNSYAFNTSPPAINSQTVRVPLVLASVSQRWRAIVHGQPSLWTSLCISPELITESSSTSESRTPIIDLTHIQSCLQRSKQSSLNILIDARDPHWNFAEAGVGLDSGEDIAITTLFSSEHMKLVVALLIPAISRWKSLTILTDTWAPMHSALSIINPSLAMYGAPRLESLTLMRCNDFVSFSPRFLPTDLKDVGFLSLSYPGSDYPFDVKHLLPRLKHLSLRGVHADWDILDCTLLSSTQNLESLELASHSADVRPSIEQLHNLLTSVSSSLKTIRISGTGPGVLHNRDDLREYASVQLPQLQNITIGYRSSREGRAILKMLNAPNARNLVLEDATYSGDPEEVNGGSLLTYLGCKEFSSSSSGAERLSSPPQIAIASYDYHAQEHHHHQMGYEDTPYLPSPYPVDHGDNKEYQQPTCVHRRKSSTASSLHCQDPRAAFPLLQNVTLKGVKSSPRALRTFFSSLAHLQHLELIEMSMQAVRALVPLSINTTFSSPASTTTPTSSCPCPQLRSLCIRDSGHRVEANDVDLIRYVAVQRESEGACELQELDLYLDSVRAASIAAVTCHSPLSPATKVNIYSDSESDDSDDEDEEEVDPFSPGGAFNDPEFDAYYSSS